MRVPNHITIRTVFGMFLITSTVLCFSSCSTEDTIKDQQRITSSHQQMLERRKIRVQARDERFRASRALWMN